jgi:dTDP-glucose pyrophosphorylase/predicted transcriptional regulator
MKDWKDILVSSDTSIRETIRIIDQGALKIALIVDAETRLLGTVSDGDIRRGILNGCDLENQVQRIMNTCPSVAGKSDGREKILALMRQKQIYQIPIVDDRGILLGLEVIENILAVPRVDNWVVLMAGGLGTRLKQLTKDTPKPLLKIGNKPILETIIQNFIEQGFKRFFISVNFKSELIERYFGDGSRWGVRIDYLREKKKLGTAGALSLLSEKPTSPVLVMNGDVLSKVNFQQLLDFHLEHKSVATICVSEYDLQVPYGVVKLDRHRILSMEEKPVQRFFINAGIYVLEPEVLERVPDNTYVDMPALFEKLLEEKKETAVFPIREYWVDIGRMDDFERAERDFGKVFQ